MKWERLLDEADLASVLPSEYEHYIPSIRGALSIFLDGLPEQWQEAVLVEQSLLHSDATPSERLSILARSCPVLHKLGQALARDRRISSELRRHLQQLESLPPSIPLETIEEILSRELGPLYKLGLVLLSPAIAEASVAVVVPFKKECGSTGKSDQGVFKLLKPGIIERLDVELELLGQVGSYLDQQCDNFQIPQLEYKELFDQVRDKLRCEVRLDLEQHHLAVARTAYASEPRVKIPRVLEYCTSRVTAMERVEGGKVTDNTLESATERQQLAMLVVKALIAQPIFSKATNSIFHGDQHAGNLFLTADQRLAILDWSLAGSLGERERRAFVQILLSSVLLDYESIVVTLSDLSEGSVDAVTLEFVVRTSLKQIRQGQLPDLSWLMGLLDAAVLNAGVRFGADLMLFRKGLHTLTGVIADIGAADGAIDMVLMKEFLNHFMEELPERLLMSSKWHGFSTRLSNNDLTRMLLSIPWTVAQFWLEQGTRIMEGACPSNAGACAV